VDAHLERRGQHRRVPRTVLPSEDGLRYVHGDDRLPVQQREVTIRYRTDTGMGERSFTAYRTHHGPVVREVDGRWVTVSLMENPQDALIQSYQRTKAANMTEFLETMELHTNSSNNTVFADAEGNIAYLHSNFVPRRDTRFDWSQPVDGTDPATDWGEPHAIDESPNVMNPPNGWVQNTNNWAYSAAGPTAPGRRTTPPTWTATVRTRGASMRSAPSRGLRTDARRTARPGLRHLSTRVRAAHSGVVERLRRPSGEPRAPAGRGAADRPPARLGLPLGVASVPTSLAVYWAEHLMDRVADDARTAGLSTTDFIATNIDPVRHVESLVAASVQLDEEFGSWETPWGEINRFQRLTGDIVQPFDDDEPSIPVGFTSARWGSLASFGARSYPGTVRRYGTSGNSFVAVVEFGERVRALAVTAGERAATRTRPTSTTRPRSMQPAI
jgi:acyl-homoserine-lactone acylase